MDSRCILKVFGAILVHLLVNKMTPKKFKGGGGGGHFGRKERRPALFYLVQRTLVADMHIWCLLIGRSSEMNEEPA
jgi:hypothetical protein